MLPKAGEPACKLLFYGILTSILFCLLSLTVHRYAALFLFPCIVQFIHERMIFPLISAGEK